MLLKSRYPLSKSVAAYLIPTPQAAIHKRHKALLAVSISLEFTIILIDVGFLPSGHFHVLEMKDVGTNLLLKQEKSII
jgi:hypothetical protein